jgi:surface protein
MFYNCKSLTFLNLSDFDMTNVTSKESMLSGTASTSKGCAVVCIESVETALKSGTSITSSYFTFVRSLDDLVQTSSISLDMNDDSGEVYNFSLLQ